MRFVNITPRNVCTPIGCLRPGAVSADGGRDRDAFEKALARVVGICGNSLGVRLNEREASLLSRLMDLDEKGRGFRPSDLPAEARKDPTGEKRAEADAAKAQQASMDAAAERNRAAAARESVINGEVQERRPVGPATMEGEKVEAEMLKSGFERLFEENARIASEKPGKEMDVGEVLDPIGAHMKKGEGQSAPDLPKEDTAGSGEDASNGEPASGGDQAPGGEAALGQAPEPADPRNRMDEQAADVAARLSAFGPPEEAPKPAAKGRGRGRSGKAKNK